MLATDIVDLNLLLIKRHYLTIIDQYIVRVSNTTLTNCYFIVLLDLLLHQIRLHTVEMNIFCSNYYNMWV